MYSGLCERDFTLTTSYSLDIGVDIMPAVSVEDLSPLSDTHGFPRHVFGMTGNLKFHLVCKVSGQSPHAPYLHISTLQLMFFWCAIYIQSIKNATGY